MVTASTSDWRLDVDGLVDEAWARVRRVVAREQSARDLERAHRAIPLVFQELTVRGVDLWRVGRTEVELTPGIASYRLASETEEVLDVMLYEPEATRRQELPLRRLSRDEYLRIPDKRSPGRPLQYWVDRQREAIQLMVWPTPDARTHYALGISRVRSFRDVLSPTDHPDVPPRWLPCLVSGTAWMIAQGTEGIDAVELQQFEVRFEKDYLVAISDDRERLPFRVTYALGDYF